MPYNTGLDGQNIEPYGTPCIVGGILRVWRSKNLLDWEHMGEPFTLDKRGDGLMYILKDLTPP